MMTVETINQLRELIREKDYRLAAIYNRLNELDELKKLITTEEEADAIIAELDELGKEIAELVAFRKKARKEICQFYKPASLVC